jgi:hypothetical protein
VPFHCFDCNQAPLHPAARRTEQKETLGRLYSLAIASNFCWCNLRARDVLEQILTAGATGYIKPVLLPHSYT